MTVWAKICASLRRCSDAEMLAVSAGNPSEDVELKKLGRDFETGLAETWDALIVAHCPGDFTAGTGELQRREFVCEAMILGRQVLRRKLDVQSARETLATLELPEYESQKSTFLTAASRAALGCFRSILHTSGAKLGVASVDVKSAVERLIVCARLWETLVQPSANEATGPEAVPPCVVPDWLRSTLDEYAGPIQQSVAKAYATIAAFDQLSIQRQSVFFPVSLQSGDAKAGFVLKATVYLLDDSLPGVDDATHEPNSVVGKYFRKLPRCAAAPWSPIRIVDDALNTRLVDLLGMRRVAVPSNRKLMYEVWPVAQQSLAVSPHSQLPQTLVSGESLTLGIVMAMWAAQSRRELRPLVVSAAVGTSGQTAGVDDLVVKLKATADWVEKTQTSLAGVLIKPTREDATSLVDVVEQPQIGSSSLPESSWQGLRVLYVPEKLDELLKDELRLTLLTDGFDRLRESLDQIQVHVPRLETDLADDGPGIYTVSDWEELAGEIDFVKKQFVSPGNTVKSPLPSNSKVASSVLDQCFSILVLPFGNDPLPATQRVVQELWGHFRNSYSSLTDSTDSLTERPVVIPLQLPAASDRWSAHQSKREHRSMWTGAANPWQLVETVRSSIHAVTGVDIQDWSDCQQALLNNLESGQSRDNLCFVLFSRESCRVDYEEEQEFLSQFLLRQFRRSEPSWPRSIFIASDLHHAKFIESILANGDAN